MSSDTKKPHGAQPQFGNIPQELKELPYWVCWRYEHKPGKNKPDKIPYDAKLLGSAIPLSDKRASSTDRKTQCPFEFALDAYRQYAHDLDGIGICLNHKCGLVGVDIDGCIGDDLDESAKQIIRQFDSYSEVSPSGRGIRIFAKGHLPFKGRNKPPYEIYETGRFLTVTGNHIPWSHGRVMERQSVIDSFVRVHFPEDDAPAMERGTELDVHTPLAERIKQARAYLERLPPTRQGNGADNYMFGVTMTVLNGYAVPADHAAELLFEFGLRGIDGAGLPYEWTAKEIERKISSAQKETYKGRIGDQLKDDWLLNIDPYAIIPSEAPQTPSVDSQSVPATPTAENPFRWKIVGDDELDALPDPEWLIDSIICRDSVFMVYGRTGSMKSFFTLEMAFCYASKTPFLNKFDVEKAGKVVYVVAEGQAGIKQRCQAWKKEHGFKNIPNFKLVMSPVNLADLKDGADFLEFLKTQVGNVDVVIFDTLNRNMIGNENSSEHIGTVIWNATAIQKALNCAVGFVHHSGWDRSRVRGHTALPSGVDTTFKVDGPGFGKGLTVVENEKTKDSETVKDFYLSARQIPLGFDRKGRPLTSLVVGYGGTVSEAAKNKEQQEESDYLACLPTTEAEAISTKEICKQLQLTVKEEITIRGRLGDRIKEVKKGEGRGRKTSHFYVV